MAIALVLGIAFAVADLVGGEKLQGKDLARSKTGNVNLLDYAKCDGTTDDTNGIQAWLNALKDGTAGYAPAGTCRFTTGLVHNGSHFSINGAGSSSTVFLYAGLSNDNDLFRFTAPRGAEVNGVRLEGFAIESTTRMTAGWALYVRAWTRSELHDVVIGGQDNLPANASTMIFERWPDGRPHPTAKLWNGVHADGADVISWDSGQIAAQNECLTINGISPTQVGSDFFFDHLKIAGCAYAGLHSAGGFGGLNTVLSDIIDNGVGIRIDRAYVDAPNRETTLGGGAAVDTSDREAILIDDPGPTYVQITGTWIASSSHGALIRVTPRSAATTINLKSAYLYNALNGSDGLLVESASARVRSTGTTYRYITGTAIKASVASMTICSVGDSFFDMPAGSVTVDVNVLGCGMPMDLPQTFTGTTDGSGSAKLPHELGSQRVKYVTGFDTIWKNNLVAQAFPSGATVNMDGANINIVGGPPNAKVWVTVRMKQYNDPNW